jgi:hypothetical protein
MTIEKFRELLHASPFVPFTIRLADDRQIPVTHSDFVASSPTGRVACVFHGPGDASTFVDVLLVTALEMNPGGSQRTPTSS